MTAHGPMHAAMALGIAVMSLACSRSEKADSPQGAGASPVTEPDASAGSPPPEACPLTTDEDLIAALGVRYTRNEEQPPRPSPTVSICLFHNGGLGLTVKTETADRSSFDKRRSVAIGTVDVPGVGDVATFQFTQNLSIVTGTFVALKSKTLLTLSFGGIGVSPEQALAAEKTLASRLLAKL